MSPLNQPIECALLDACSNRFTSETMCLMSCTFYFPTADRFGLTGQGWYSPPPLDAGYLILGSPALRSSTHSKG